MPLEIKWSTRAVYEWVDILEYWINRNKSNTYSLKLDKLFKEKFDLIAKSPDTGKPTDFPMVRIKSSGTTSYITALVRNISKS